MKYLLFLLFPVLMISQIHCSDLLRGKFKPKRGPFMNNYEIIRTDSTQTDYDKLMNTVTEFEIVWVDSCEYKLKKIRGKGYKNINGFDMKYLTFKIDSVSKSELIYFVLDKQENNLIDTTYLVRVE